MKEKILENIGNPEKLEELFQTDRKAFESGFNDIYPEVSKTDLAKFWKIRLDSEITPDKTVNNVDRRDIFFVVIACLIAGFLVKIPDIFNLGITDSLFFEKNLAIIVFLGLTIYVLWINRILDKKKLGIALLAFMIPAVYSNLLPEAEGSSSVDLVYIHLPLLMWCIFGIVFIDFAIRDKPRRIEFIRFNGDLAILAALITIAGGILTALTIGLFSAIGINIENFYMENVAMIGAVSVPVVVTFILKNFPAMTNKIAPVIAGIFSPLVLVTAIIYLAAFFISGKDPYNNRDFLLIFNIMLIGVMAIITFSVSESPVIRMQRFNSMVLFILAIITVIIDLIALSAIFYRLGTFGVTPNRLAVVGANILILGNLILIIVDLYRVNFKKYQIEEVGFTISKYLPVYAIWIFFVVFGFPLIFHLR